MTDKELFFIINALKEIEKNHKKWSQDYTYDKHTNEFSYKNESKGIMHADRWFRLDK